MLDAASCADEATGRPDRAASIPADFLDLSAGFELEAETAMASVRTPSAVKPSRADEYDLFFTRAKNEELEVEKRDCDEVGIVFFFVFSVFDRKYRERNQTGSRLSIFFLRKKSIPQVCRRNVAAIAQATPRFLTGA